MNTALAQTISDIRESVAAARGRNLQIGFVPTMGALHQGHGALIQRAREENGYLVVSVFVNPIQFDRKDDFDRYPRTLETDVAFCQQLGADIVFAPSANEMYAEPMLTSVDVATLGDKLCGAFRPGHFRGVSTVVAKLFNIVNADRVYFGEKDAQQLAIISRMASDLNFACEIVPVATVREPDGLAMSSRNVRLTSEERQVAPAVYRGLRAAAAVVERGGGVVDARNAALDVYAACPPLRVEYFELVDLRTMQPVEHITAGPVRAVTAVWLGATRLIDNALCVPATG